MQNDHTDHTRGITVVDKIDYDTNQLPTAGSTAGAYWIAFGLSAVVGIVIASILDEVIYHYLTGRYPDGGATFISIAAVPLGAIAAAVSRSIRKRSDWKTAASFGVISAPTLLVILYAFF